MFDGIGQLGPGQRWRGLADRSQNRLDDLLKDRIIDWSLADAVSSASRCRHAGWNGCASPLIKASSDVPSTSSILSQQATSIMMQEYPRNPSRQSPSDPNGLPLSTVSTAFKNPR